jgi:hypothetical protein
VPEGVTDQDEAAGSWRRVGEFYRELVEGDRWEHCRPMLEVVEAMAASEWARVTWARTSHQVLMVQAGPGEHPEEPQVLVDPGWQATNGEYRVELWRHCGRLALRRLCPPSAVRTLLVSLILRLPHEAAGTVE